MDESKCRHTVFFCLRADCRHSIILDDYEVLGLEIGFENISADIFSFFVRKIKRVDGYDYSRCPRIFVALGLSCPYVLSRSVNGAMSHSLCQVLIAASNRSSDAAAQKN